MQPFSREAKLTETPKTSFVLRCENFVSLFACAQYSTVGSRCNFARISLCYLCVSVVY